MALTIIAQRCMTAANSIENYIGIAIFVAIPIVVYFLATKIFKEVYNYINNKPKNNE